MIKGTRRSPGYITYTFGEQEFKKLLGIGDDPHGVLTVEVSFSKRAVTVTMSGTASEEGGHGPGH